MSINIPVSTGELIDKITILEIKYEKIQDQKKLQNVFKELEALRQVMSTQGFSSDELNQMIIELKNINLKLWEIEDLIRIKEANNEFDGEFTRLARSVYQKNDIRACIKKKINTYTKSDFVEEKSYEGC